MTVRSVRYSILPDFDSCTALATSIVTVPTFGLGILPAGPRIRPRRPTTAIRSGVAIATSNSSKPSWMRLREVLAPHHVCAGRFGLGDLRALGEDDDLDVACRARWAARSCRAAARRRGAR